MSLLCSWDISRHEQSETADLRQSYTHRLPHLEGLLYKAHAFLHDEQIC